MAVVLKRPKRKRGQRAGLTRDKILTAALIAFFQPDASISVSALARRIKVFPRAIHSQFPGGLAEILSELVRIALEHATPPVAHHETGEDYLRRLFEAARSVFHSHPGLAKFVGAQLAEEPYLSPGLAERVLGALRAMEILPQRLPEALHLVVAMLAGFLTAEFPPVTKRSAADWIQRQEDALERLALHEFPELAAARGLLFKALAEKAAQLQEAAAELDNAKRCSAFVIAGLQPFIVKKGRTRSAGILSVR